jgi:hypothetical protein
VNIGCHISQYRIEKLMFVTEATSLENTRLGVLLPLQLADEK